MPRWTISDILPNVNTDLKPAQFRTNQNAPLTKLIPTKSFGDQGMGFGDIMVSGNNFFVCLGFATKTTEYSVDKPVIVYLKIVYDDGLITFDDKLTCWIHYDSAFINKVGNTIGKS